VRAEAAKLLAKFDEAVLTGVDADDYPVSIRVNPGDYDARTGTLPATFPAALHVIEAPANVVAQPRRNDVAAEHGPDQGRLESRADGWAFRSKNFDAPAKLAFVHFLMNNSTAARSISTSEDCSVRRSIGLNPG
jgi:hypothetical protein